MRSTQIIIGVILAVSVSLIGCHSRAWVDSWRPVPVKEGMAWHNEAYQQTVFDVNSDGRIDRLRFWVGSGLAEEFMDDDLDGWIDSYVSIVYGESGERTHVLAEAPNVPVTNSTGAFKRPKQS